MTPTFKPLASAGSDGQFALPEDGFVMAFPFGEWRGEILFKTRPQNAPQAVQTADGIWKLPFTQVLDEAAAIVCAAAFKPDTLIDYEHASNTTDGESRAAGWCVECQVRDDGFYVRPRWSADGLADVVGGNYRYLSPVFPWDGLKHLGGDRYRPGFISDLALTNTPRLRGIAAVSNSETPLNEPRVGLSGSAPETTAGEQGEERKMREMLIQALGLPPEATDDDVVKAVGDMKAKLDEMTKAEMEAAVENDLREHADRIENREAVKQALMTDRPGTLKVLNALRKPAPAAALNRGGARTPQEKAVVGTSAQMAAVQAIRNRDKCGFEQAWNTARVEQPSLFIDKKEKT